MNRNAQYCKDDNSFQLDLYSKQFYSKSQDVNSLIIYYLYGEAKTQHSQYNIKREQSWRTNTT